LHTEDELINDLNKLKRENKKKAEEKTAKAEKAVVSMFGTTPGSKRSAVGL